MTAENVRGSASRIAWSIDDLTVALGVSKGFLRGLIKAGKLPHKKIGRRVLILDQELQEFLSMPGTLVRNEDKEFQVSGNEGVR